ncbi:5-formyltetrahydrofolate cyclo-ligase [Prorops nasuta]|uniref:5-formyltetrahydrofolate cyclo-ligase n=1 Tax=Prorops nasuta TaxID=863751 RepID=UPI0034CDB293
MTMIKTVKSALREEIANVIKTLSVEDKNNQSLRVFEKIIKLPQYQTSKRVSVYLSTEDEIDTLPIIKHMFNAEKEVFVPRYRGKVCEMVKLHSMEDYDQLPLTKWNIKQPSFKDVRDNALETGGLDLVLLPGVGFTNDGKRLGHGMGYYDKFLHNCFSKQEKKPFLVGIAFNEQIRTEIPMTEEDVPLDIVITEK